MAAARSSSIAIALIACGSGIHATRAPIVRSEPSCQLNGSYADVGAAGDDAPLVALYQRNPFFAPDVPMLVIWADGTLAAAHGGTWTRATIAPTDAVRIAHDIADDLHGATRHAAVSTSTTDLPEIGIVARDGAGWRISEVYGIEPHARGDGFAAAYRELLAAIPTSTTPYEPTDFGVGYSPFDHANATAPWPADLPAPPADAIAGGMFTIPASYAPQLQAFRDMMRDHQSLAIVFNDHRWWIQIVRRYRGQATIDRVWTCARDRRDE